MPQHPNEKCAGPKPEGMVSTLCKQLKLSGRFLHQGMHARRQGKSCGLQQPESNVQGLSQGVSDESQALSGGEREMQGAVTRKPLHRERPQLQPGAVSRKPLHRAPPGRAQDLPRS